MPTTAEVHSEDGFYFVRNLYLSIVTDELTHSSPKSDVVFQGAENLSRRLHGVDIRTQGVFANTDLGHLTPESIARVSGNLVSVATVSFLLGMLKAGNLDLKCFHMENLVDSTAH